MRIVSFAMIMCISGPALADGKRDGYRPEKNEYRGVTPGVVHPYRDGDYKRRAKTPRHRGKSRVYWVGFQPRNDGGARLFLRLSREIAVTQAINKKRQLVVQLAGVRGTQRRLLRPLYLRHFGTVLDSVRLRHVRARGFRGSRLVISFRKPAWASEAAVSSRKEKDGYHYIYLDFGRATGDSSSREASQPTDD